MNYGESYMLPVSYVELHNAGMPVRLVFMPNVPGKTMTEKKEYCRNKLDWIRRLLTYEPRGSSNSYGVLITEPSNRSASFGAVFFDSSGWHDMCGHASIGFTCYAVRSGLVEPKEPAGWFSEVICRGSWASSKKSQNG